MSKVLLIFISFFLPFVFEKPLRSFVLSNLLQFLSHDETTEEISNSVMQIFKICSLRSAGVRGMRKPV